MCKLHKENDKKCRKEIIEEVGNSKDGRQGTIRMWDREPLRGTVTTKGNEILLNGEALPAGLIGTYLLY
jgi:hypothetical protein